MSQESPSTCACLIGFGSNMGDGPAVYSQILAMLGKIDGVTAVRGSRLYANRAIGGPPGQPDFVNGAIWLECQTPPLQLLGVLRRMEAELGRKREIRWGPRCIDLDLLLYSDAVIRDPELTVPHPGLLFRRFVLEPAREIAGDMIHPQLGWTVGKLQRHAASAAPVYAVVCDDARLAKRIAASLATRAGYELVNDVDLATTPSTPKTTKVVTAMTCRGNNASRTATGEASKPPKLIFYVSEQEASLSVDAVRRDTPFLRVALSANRPDAEETAMHEMQSAIEAMEEKELKPLDD